MLRVHVRVSLCLKLEARKLRTQRRKVVGNESVPYEAVFIVCLLVKMKRACLGAASGECLGGLD